MRIVSLFLISIITLYANVGNLSGNLSVNNGALNYNVALKLPAGIAGHTPQVSLNYNSNGANGYFGQGWSLTGLSTISRCGSNLEFDGVKKGVKYTSEDNICLDGQRLVPTSGNKWDDNSIYKTKIESYSKITLNSNIFTVYTKAGEIKEYTLINQTWYLTSIKDRYDNTITYNYTSTSSEVYLNNIAYGDNTIQLNYEDRLDKTNIYSSGYNIQINKRVSSIDIKNGSNILRNYDLTYKAQSSAINKSLVESIKECSLGTCLDPIKFEEKEPSQDKFESHIKWVAEGDHPSGFVQRRDPNHGVYVDLKDMNGDGLLDRVGHYNYSTKTYGFYVGLNTGNGFEPLEKWVAVGDHPSGFVKREDPNHGVYVDLIDMNGDGLLDRVGHYNYSTKTYGFYVGLNTGNGFEPLEKWVAVGDHPSGFIQRRDPNHGVYVDLKDMNGDGLPDRVGHYNYLTKTYGFYVGLNTGNGFEPLEKWVAVGDHPSGFVKREDPNHGVYVDLIDMNGDGLLDRVGHHNYVTDTGGFHVGLNTGNGFEPLKKWVAPGEHPSGFIRRVDPKVGVYSDLIDMNGDGLPDRVGHYNYTTDTYGFYVGLNTGNGFKALEKWTSVGEHPSGFIKRTDPDLGVYVDLKDMNGDGLPDKVGHYNYLTKTYGFYVGLNTGNGFEPHRRWTSLGEHPSGFVQRRDPKVGVYVDLKDMNGDGLPDKVGHHNYVTDTGGFFVGLNTGNGFAKMISITDSFGNETNINYKQLTNDSVYIKQNNATYPNRDLQTSQQLVSSIVSKTPTGENSTTSYTYEGLKTNLKGLGSLGFAKITSINDLNDIKTVTEYNQNYPLVGTINKTTTTMGSNLISEATNTYSSTEINGISKIYLNQSIVKNYQDAIHLSTTINENNSFDTYGNILTTSSTIKDETTNETFVTNKVDTYTNDETNWLLGKLTNTIVTSNAYGDTKTKETSFTYDETTGSLLSKTIEPNKTKWLKKSYQYNANGTLNTETISGADILSATTTYGYDGLGRNTSITNALGHSVNKTYDNEGKVLSITDANGIFTNFTYDNFGKKLSETKAGITTTYTYAYDSSVENSLYKVTVQRNGTAPKTTYYNSLGMALQTTTIGFDGRVIISSQKYDKYGNVVEKIKPHFEGDTSQSIYYTYDDYKRLSSTDSPGENIRIIESITYNGFSTITTNAKQQNKTTIKNVLGKVVKIEEPMGATITYKYDALGNLIETKDANGITISLGYDIYGNKISQNDPDMGTWTYTYNALGKLVSQTDAKGQVTNITYDELGRKKTETLSNGDISRWYYDATNAKGKIAKETKEDSLGNILFEKIYSYNTLSRIDNITTKIDDKTFVKTYSYDNLGRITNKTLPNSFELINEYNDNGYLISVKSPKTQIEDFNRNHFFTLIQSTLDNSQNLYRKSIEYLNEANDLYVKVDDYRIIAGLSTTSTGDANQLNEIANQLEANANALKFEANYYKKQSDAHKITVDGYLVEALNSNSINGINQLEEFYNELHTIYNTYSTNILAIAAEFVGHATIASNTSESIEYYLSISIEALAEATIASQKADNFKNLADNYSNSENELVAYQDILSDENYNYFYKVLKYNAYNQVVSYMLGNGLITNTSFNESGTISNITTGYNHTDGIRNLEFTYDSLGNLLTRKDHKLNVEQSYTYDNLNRVTDVDIVTATNNEYLDYSYNLSGNIMSKSDVGNYIYNPNTHQVITAGAKTLTYDANGNVLTNDTSSFIYTPFNKASQIITSNKSVSFYYDMNKKRYKKLIPDDSITYYVDKVYENISSSQTGEIHRYFIYVNGQVVAIYNSKDGKDSTKYLHYDSLNSVDTITNNLGAVNARMAYKPFGKKLNLDKNGVETTIAPFTNRGYTGHEHIEGTSFIHMNARVYDSELARFMSADTLVVHPLDTQDFNRYSYTKNNPLKYIDPSGHGWLDDKWESLKEKIQKHEKEIAIVAVSYATGGAVGWLASSYFNTTFIGGTIIAETLTGIIAGAAAGGVTAYTAVELYGLDSNLKYDMIKNGMKAGALNGGISAALGTKEFKELHPYKKATLTVSTNVYKTNKLYRDYKSGMLMGAISAAIFDLEWGDGHSSGTFFDDYPIVHKALYQSLFMDKVGRPAIDTGKEALDLSRYYTYGLSSGLEAYSYLEHLYGDFDEINKEEISLENSTPRTY